MARRLTPGHHAGRLLAWVSLVLMVLLGHGCVVRQLAVQSEALRSAAEPPPRWRATYVRAMKPTTLLTQAAASRRLSVPKQPTRGPLWQSMLGAIAAASGASEPFKNADPSSAAEIPAQGASAPATAASVPLPTLPSDPLTTARQMAASEASAPGFTWPQATRVSFDLKGYWQGEIFGSAQVEWVRQGDRYQVHLDTLLGPALTPFASRRITSEGVITTDGLVPQRYGQETRIAFGQPMRSVIQMEAHGVRLSNGRWVERWPGLQDTASQFIQLAWLFSTQPERLTAGAVIEVPLALPRRLERVRYDVLGPEPLVTPFGAVPVFHLKPQREVQTGGDMTVDMWIAPQYLHLPIRLRIRADPATYADLMITRPPELADPVP